MTPQKLKYPLAAVVVVVFVAIIFLVSREYVTDHKKSSNAQAQTSSSSLTSQSDWQLGNSSNGIDLVSTPGSVKLSAEYQINTAGMIVTAGIDSADKLSVFDNNVATQWGGLNTSDYWWLIDLGSEYHITKLTGYNITNTVPIDIMVSTSQNGVDFTYKDEFHVNIQQDVIINTSNVRYIRFYPLAISPPAPSTQLKIGEVKIFSIPNTATHTTAATQIDGTANFYQWQTFTPSETIPANSTITYKFRTSKDGESWTDYTAAQSIANGVAADISALVTSRDGPADNPANRYRYLQVQATLTSTDGVANPVISQYDIGFHTNQKPNTPTAQSVTIAP